MCKINKNHVVWDEEQCDNDNAQCNQWSLICNVMQPQQFGNCNAAVVV